MSTYAKTDLEKVRPYLTNRNTENMFSISLRHRVEKKKKHLLTLIIKM